MIIASAAVLLFFDFVFFFVPFCGVLIHMAFQNGLDLDSNPTNTFMLHDSPPLPGGSAEISALRL